MAESQITMTLMMKPIHIDPGHWLSQCLDRMRAPCCMPNMWPQDNRSISLYGFCSAHGNVIIVCASPLGHALDFECVLQNQGEKQIYIEISNIMSGQSLPVMRK